MEEKIISLKSNNTFATKNNLNDLLVIFFNDLEIVKGEIYFFLNRKIFLTLLLEYTVRSKII